MTRKDYVVIAGALALARKFSETDNQRRGTERAALAIAAAMAIDNPRFDRNKFLTACGLSA